MSNSKRVRREWLLREEVQRGQRSDDVVVAQRYMERFGYLAPGTYEVGALDAMTSEGLGLVQRHANVPITGDLTHATAQWMNRPRCGLPDLNSPFFLLSTVKSVTTPFAKRVFTFRFINGTADLAGNAEQTAIRNAFATWAAATGLSFNEVAVAPSDIEVEWATGAHGAGGHPAFDNAGGGMPFTNIVAHAFHPRPTHPATDSGRMHFDDFEPWSLSGGANNDLEACALHEIGHLLGFNHTDDASAVMSATLQNGLITLQPEDLERANRVYGLGRLWHSIRHGNPWTQFADVEGEAGERGRFVDVACASMGDQLHVCGVTSEGELWHSIRTGNPWTPFGSVGNEAGRPGSGRFVRVSCAVMSNELHVLAITDDGELWHSIRKGNPWTPFRNVQAEAGARGRFRSVASATIGAELHVCGVTDDGELWHSIRKGNPWTQFKSVKNEAGDRGAVIEVAATSAGNQLYVFATTVPGRMWWSIRQGNPWTSFEDVSGPDATGQLVDDFFLTAGAATLPGEVHLCAVTDRGRIFHAIKKIGGGWTKLADVEPEAGERGDFGRVGCGGLGPRLHVCAIAIENWTPPCDC